MADSLPKLTRWEATDQTGKVDLHLKYYKKSIKNWQVIWITFVIIADAIVNYS